MKQKKKKKEITPEELNTDILELTVEQFLPLSFLESEKFKKII